MADIIKSINPDKTICSILTIVTYSEDVMAAVAEYMKKDTYFRYTMEEREYVKKNQLKILKLFKKFFDQWVAEQDMGIEEAFDGAVSTAVENLIFEKRGKEK